MVKTNTLARRLLPTLAFILILTQAEVRALLLPSVLDGEPAKATSISRVYLPTILVTSHATTSSLVPRPIDVSTAVVAPEITWVGSPNFNRRPHPDDISAIVIHATAGGTLRGVISWFRNPASKVSAHYTVGKDGRIVQHVRDEHRAWHAGVSEWRGRKDLNNWSIGIELVNWNDGQDPYPEAQRQAVVQLVTFLCHKYHISPALILGHHDVAPNRKTDPLGYDLEQLRREVRARLGQ